MDRLIIALGSVPGVIDFGQVIVLLGLAILACLLYFTSLRIDYRRHRHERSGELFKRFNASTKVFLHSSRNPPYLKEFVRQILNVVADDKERLKFVSACKASSDGPNLEGILKFNTPTLQQYDQSTVRLFRKILIISALLVTIEDKKTATLKNVRITKAGLMKWGHDRAFGYSHKRSGAGFFRPSVMSSSK